MALRTCEQCGWKMEPGTPRKSVRGRRLCGKCAKDPLTTTASGGTPMPDLRKIAHDSGDGQTIYHCPFCGSGQVIARSDRTIECQFCHQCFTVQVQPQFPAFPQTIDGQPVQVPGMPGQIGTDQGMGMDPNADPMGGGDPMDPNADPNAPMDPSQVGDDGEEAPADDDQDDGGNPFAKGSMLRTSRGHLVPAEDFTRHLAIAFAQDPNAVAANIKQSRSER